MRKVVRKLFVDFEKEEQWLNDMATKGFQLVDFSFMRYVFEEGTPGEYIYRLELLDQMAKHPESQAYIQFMEESGVECVSEYGRWVFFRKKSSEGPFELFSNNETLVGHYKKILTLVGILGGVNLFIAIINFCNGFFISGMKSLAYISVINWAVVLLFLPLILSYWKTYSHLKRECDLFE